VTNSRFEHEIGGDDEWCSPAIRVDFAINGFIIEQAGLLEGTSDAIIASPRQAICLCEVLGRALLMVAKPLPAVEEQVSPLELKIRELERIANG
jgi:hypothetical protein